MIYVFFCFFFLKQVIKKAWLLMYWPTGSIEEGKQKEIKNIIQPVFFFFFLFLISI